MIDIEQATRDYAEACKLLADAEPPFRELELLSKTIYGKCFLRADGGVKEREMTAFQDAEYVSHVRELSAAQGAYIVARARRDAKQAAFECSRSQSSMQRTMLEKNIYDQQ